MSDAEAKRIRDLVARDYAAWSGYEPRGDQAYALRSLLWEIDHPSRAEQTPETWSAWIDQIEPRWPANGMFLHPDWVEEIRQQGMKSAAQIQEAINRLP
ncbi:hypothetical protein [Streptomyces parvus]|uniref:Uncharacterized protein n=1 Tax=Streptomyces parvus TaxID=66428 RepID=A0A7K3S126_9ACTN|nr:hypothetical protein [Streptomyces parvus]NEC21191.1 hypothetical protein [Streptomyces parvus]NEE33135.1 hypothetical protein [Streptomyces sp. SID7982]